ncbi:hypothetical protein ACEPAG_2281 [Sanghuangporus baumii]
MAFSSFSFSDRAALGWIPTSRTGAQIVAAAGFFWTIGLGVYLYYRRQAQEPEKRTRGHGLPLPPGPKPLPIIGNALDMPMKREWEALTKWGEEYGDLVHVNVLGKHIIYINSYKVAYELFERRGSLYSDKPRLPLLNELMDFDWNFGLVHYGDQWRKYRRAFVSKYGGTVVQMFNPTQERATALLLERLLETPEKFIDHLRLHAGQLIMLSVYGIFINSRQHPYVVTAEIVMDSVSQAARPGAWLVDYLPILKRVPAWLPFANYMRTATHWADNVRQLRFVPFQACKAKLVDSGPPPYASFVADMLQEHGYDDKEAEMMIQDCAAVAYGAGSDTSVATLSVFMLAMVLYPEVQKKAQEEIARVVGVSRLPTFADRKDLPYITAIAKETLRWHTVAPQALPHQLREDDVYEGYYLPKGAIIIGNAWRMAHDPAVYPDPFKFKPERFFNSDGKLDYAATDPVKYSFGFGRRLCAGYHFAENTLWITIACLLQCYNIAPAKDKTGNPIPVKLDPSSGIISRPEAFPCSITPRSDLVVELIRQAASEAMSLFQTA